MKRLVKLSMIFFVSLLLGGCARVVIDDPSIKVHWMSRGEAAPFDGILLNDYAYMKIREKLDECR